MDFVPHKPKQRTPLRNKIRGAVYGAVAGVVAGALGSLFLGWEILLTTVLVGGVLGFGLVVILKSEPPVIW